jgi:hypothetical protein
MKPWMGILLLFCSLLLLPYPAISACMDLSVYSSWYAQDDHTLIVIHGHSSMAKVVLKDCTVSSSSSIRLTKSYMCDSDPLIVDGQKCGIMTLLSSSGGGF